jgi:multiple sugar transport system substrate-binding protein
MGAGRRGKASMNIGRSTERGLTRRDFLKMSGAGLAGAAMLGGAACGGSRGSGPVELTFWSWVPDIQNEVKLFEEAHPDIKIKYVNAGQGEDEYTKLRTAIKSGSGAPDVVQIEFQYLATFQQLDALADLSEYGANDVKDDFVPWTWEQVSEGSSVYAIPQDSGPMGLLYRKDIFDKYGLTVPETWAEFEEQARKLHEANPDIYIADFLADGGWFTGLMWQAGARPFEVSGENISINMNDPAAMQVAEYWGGLVDEELVATKPPFTNEWYTALSNGTYASWVTAAWGPVFLAGIAGESKGKWRAAPLPQWSAGDNVSANWGGSTSAVTTQSDYPEEATEFAIWLNHNPESAKMLAEKSFLFPTLESLLYSEEFKNQTDDFYGGQKVNSVFIQASEQVDKGFEWSPFQDYVYTKMQEQLQAAADGKIGFPQVMDQLDSNITDYAKSQGFKVQ